MKKLLFCALLAVLPVSLASADLKVATVDLGKAFDSYYKTKEIQAHLREKQQEAQKELQDKISDYQRISDEVQTLDKERNDPTLAPEAQKEKAKAFAQRGADLQAAGRQIQEYKTEKESELKDELVRRHAEVVGEISKIIPPYSGPQGYDLVLDKSAAAATSGVPMILYSSPKLIDITDAIIKQLNANAPATIPGDTSPVGTVPLVPPTPATH